MTQLYFKEKEMIGIQRMPFPVSLHSKNTVIRYVADERKTSIFYSCFSDYYTKQSQFYKITFMRFNLKLKNISQHLCEINIERKSPVLRGKGS